MKHAFAGWVLGRAARVFATRGALFARRHNRWIPKALLPLALGLSGAGCRGPETSAQAAESSAASAAPPTGTTTGAAAARGGSLILRERLMEGRAELVIDPEYQTRPFRGLVRHRVGADLYGNTIPGTYVASLFDPRESSVFDIRRAWLLRGESRVRVRALKVEAGDVLAFSLGRLAPVLARGPYRPECALGVSLRDASGRDVFHESIPLGTDLESRWTERRVSLESAAGLTLELELALEGPWCSSDDHALLGDFHLFTETPPAAERPNLVVIWVDKLRADLARPDTGIPGHMPFLHELTRRGVLFTEARANCNNTFCSTVSALTSDLNGEVLSGGSFESDVPPLGIPALPRVLDAAGYHTTCLGANIHIARVPDGASRRQVDLGFDRCTIDYRAIPDEDDDARIAREQLVPWLESQVREPFYLNLHYDGAHEPYPNVDKKHLPERWQDYLARGQGDPQAALYLYKAELFDRVLRDTFERLEQRGLLERTLVVVASDHGTTLGPDHRFFMFGRYLDIRATHAGGMYDEQVRTLLLFVHPRLQPAWRSENVQLLDLAPTVLDFLRVPVPSEFLGRSRLAALTGGVALPDAPIFFTKEQEHLFGLFEAPYKLIYWAKPQERWPIAPEYVPGWDPNKVDDENHANFVRQIQRYRAQGMPIGEPRSVSAELFDVSADPRELNDLSAERPELAAALRERLEKVISSQQLPRFALDEARETLAFAAPERTVFEGTIESDGPLKPSTPLPGCDPWQLQRPDSNTLAFRCGVHGKLAGLTFYRRAQSELRLTIRRNGALLAPRDIYLGPDGLPSVGLLAQGEAVVLPASAQPGVSARTPEIVAERDSGAFIFRQVPSSEDDESGGDDLNRAFAAWGYRQ